MHNAIIVETSARHVHLCQADLEALFGPGAALHRKKDLSQPGQYACEERVELVGPKRSLAGVSVLGPLRSATQAEISLTDARSIGVDIPVRESGDLAGTPGFTLRGPAGTVEVKQGLIAAKRHIHTTPADAAALGVTDKDTVAVRIGDSGRALTFGDVVVRVSESFATAMHIDTDEANAAAAGPDSKGIIVK